MESEEKICCWVAFTRFSGGIYLFNPKGKTRFVKNASIVGLKSYSEAITMIKKEAEFEIDFSNFKLNCLHKIKNSAIYTVFYNKLGAGFVNEYYTSQFLEDNGIQIKFVKSRNHMEYLQAQAYVQNLGAITGKGKVFMTNPPVESVWYRRQRW